MPRESIPTSSFRPVVERFLSEFPTIEDAVSILAARTSLEADSWRRRLNDDRWWGKETIPVEDVDEFLVAAGLPHLYEVLDPQEEVDVGPLVKKCPKCGEWLPVAAFSKDRRRPYDLACWCRACKAADTRRYRKVNAERLRAYDRERAQRTRTYAERRKPGKRIQPRRPSARMNATQVAAAYRLYREGFSVNELGEMLWQRFGFPRAIACRNAIVTAFKYEGYPMRSKSEGARLWRARQREQAAA